MQGIAGIYCKYKRGPCLKGAHSLIGGKICRCEKGTYNVKPHINVERVVYTHWLGLEETKEDFLEEEWFELGLEG